MKRTTLSTYIRFALASGEFNAVLLRRQKEYKADCERVILSRNSSNA